MPPMLTPPGSASRAEPVAVTLRRGPKYPVALAHIISASPHPPSSKLGQVRGNGRRQVFHPLVPQIETSCPFGYDVHLHLHLRFFQTSLLNAASQ